MKVILGCDPLLMPLTGIGYYTKNLGAFLLEHSDVQELLLYAHGKFFEQELIDSKTLSKSSNTALNAPFLSNVRTRLSQNKAMVRLYERVIPHINKIRLNKHKHSIFHSPNFLMPDFQGKTVVTIHDLSTLFFSEFHPKARVEFVNNAILQATKRADIILTDSTFVKNELVDTFNISSDRVRDLHLGASKEFRSRNEIECADILKSLKFSYKKYFLFVSTFEPRKNILKLLNAYSDFRKVYPAGYPLLLAGSNGWKNKEVFSVLNELEEKGWVKYLGYVTDCTLAILFSGARALLFPSIYEGFGLPVLEAMQSGTAVMTSQNSSMSEIAENAAILIDPSSEQSILDGILELFSNDDKVRDLQQKGLERASCFSWEKYGEEVVSLYRELS